ncbi:hypothetical protein DFP73DRAFT_546334 [Morchella snyderi]|nr:hypothetical protein DFP73DRAFT_546334 [Morchella snyderi]
MEVLMATDVRSSVSLMRVALLLLAQLSLCQAHGVRLCFYVFDLLGVRFICRLPTIKNLWKNFKKATTVLLMKWLVGS